MADVSSLTLNNGVELPAPGLGVFQHGFDKSARKLGETRSTC